MIRAVVQWGSSFLCTEFLGSWVTHEWYYYSKTYKCYLQNENMERLTWLQDNDLARISNKYGAEKIAEEYQKLVNQLCSPVLALIELKKKYWVRKG